MGKEQQKIGTRGEKKTMRGVKYFGNFAILLKPSKETEQKDATRLQYWTSLQTKEKCVFHQMEPLVSQLIALYKVKLKQSSTVNEQTIIFQLHHKYFFDCAQSLMSAINP